MTDPATHSLTTIQQVARGLTMVIGPQAAAEELRRVYGEVRAAHALLAMAPAALAHRAADRPAGSRPAAGRPATYSLPARAPRRQLATRGHRQADWL